MDKGNLHIQIMIYTMDNFQIIEKKDMVLRFMQMVKNMKEIGLIIKEMVMVNSTSKMNVLLKMESNKEKEFIELLIKIYIMENIKMIKDTEKGFWKDLMEIDMKEIGLKIKFME